MPGIVEVPTLRGNNSTDFTAARDAYREQLRREGVPGADTWEKPADLTWHHHENCLTMVLESSAINLGTAHTGGAAHIRNGTCS